MCVDCCCSNLLAIIQLEFTWVECVSAPRNALHAQSTRMGMMLRLHLAHLEITCSSPKEKWAATKRISSGSIIFLSSEIRERMQFVTIFFVLLCCSDISPSFSSLTYIDVLCVSRTWFPTKVKFGMRLERTMENYPPNIPSDRKCVTEAK